MDDQTDRDCSEDPYENNIGKNNFRNTWDEEKAHRNDIAKEHGREDGSSSGFRDVPADTAVVVLTT